MVINKIDYLHLSFPDVNDRLTEYWMDNECIRAGELTVAMYEYLPEQLYGAFAMLMTSLMNDIVREDALQWFKETEVIKG